MSSSPSGKSSRRDASWDEGRSGGVHVPDVYGGTRSDVSMTRSDVYGVHVHNVYGSSERAKQEVVMKRLDDLEENDMTAR